MLNLAIFLLVLGVLAILLEMLLPGFDSYISGVIGILSLVGAAIIAAFFVEGGWLLVATSLSALFAATTVLLFYIKNKQMQGKIVLNDALLEDLPQIDIKGLLGQEGKTTTQLRPTGEADFNGVRVEVTTLGQMIDRGARVKVVQTQGNKVVVALVDGN